MQNIFLIKYCKLCKIKLKSDKPWYFKNDRVFCSQYCRQNYDKLINILQ